MFLLKTLALKTVWAMKRSWKWPALRRKVLKACGGCAACGGTAKLVVHHIKPFHKFPELELDPTNLIVLCEAPGMDCHLRIGHGRDWDMWNPNVIADAAALKAHPELLTKVWSSARTSAINNLSVSS